MARTQTMDARATMLRLRPTCIVGVPEGFDFAFGPVRGYLAVRGTDLLCPVIATEAQHVGRGWGTRCVAALERYAEQRGLRLVFPNVVNARFEAWLRRRGYTLEHQWAEAFGETVECWAWP